MRLTLGAGSGSGQRTRLQDGSAGAGSTSAAAGQASIVRGTDETGASVVLFGTEPMFRDHPKGLYSQVAKALFHTAVTAAVPAP